MMLSRWQPRGSSRPGYVLFAVVIVIVVLTLAAYRYADSMSTEYQASIRNTEAAQAKVYAISGVHYAAGLLADPIGYYGELAGNPYDNPYFSGVIVDEMGARGGGRFSLINLTVADGSGNYLFGVSDESGKININALITLDPTGELLYNALMGIPTMTPDAADAIVDWVDPDSSPRTNGAEDQDYAGGDTPYRCKNGPINSIEELLLVRGVTPQLLYGNDRNRNGVIDAGEEDGGQYSLGWSAYLTCYGREVNVDSNGVERIGINDTDIARLSQNLTAAVGQELSDYIVYFRMTGTARAAGSAGSNAIIASPSALRDLVQAGVDSGARLRRRVSSFMALFNTEIQLPNPPMAPPNTPPTVVPCPLNDLTGLQNLLPILMESTSTSQNYELTPRVNINTAPREVLAAVAAISGNNAVTATDIDAIIAARMNQSPSEVATLNASWLVTTGTLSPEKFRDIERYITGRTFTYRIHSVGYFANAGPVARVEAVVDTALGTPRFLYFRDLTDLGRGFTNLPK